MPITPIIYADPNLAPRNNHRMIYDTINNRIILFGGRAEGTDSVFFNDTWQLDLNHNTWTKPQPRLTKNK